MSSSLSLAATMTPFLRVSEHSGFCLSLRLPCRNRGTRQLRFTLQYTKPKALGVLSRTGLSCLSPFISMKGCARWLELGGLGPTERRRLAPFLWESILYCKIQFCVAGKSTGWLESLRSGFFTSQPKQPRAQRFLIFSSVRLKRDSLLWTRVTLK